MKLTNDQINQYVIKFESELLKAKRIVFTRDKTWTRANFPDEAGIYVIYDKGELIYIGESANVRLRMQEVKRTYNHSIKKIISKKYFKGELIGSSFSLETEAKIDQYLLDHITFSSLPLNFGRLEMESYLLHRNEHKLFNKIGKRNRIPELKNLK
jgi:hypothetical protein